MPKCPMEAPNRIIVLNCNWNGSNVECHLLGHFLDELRDSRRKLIGEEYYEFIDFARL